MDCQHVVGVADSTNYSALLGEAAELLSSTLKIECPIVHVSNLASHSYPDIYLVPFFEGETYESVKERGVPIIGPAALIYLIKHEILLPRRLKKGQDIYSLTLNGDRVCCSNIDKETRDSLYRKVEAMGGSISTALTSDVTHLVVEEVGSKKYQFAVKLGIPIMSPGWITALWEKSKSQVFKNDKTLVDQYKCLPFRGCTICVTGLDVGQRSEVERLTAKFGGTYSGDLCMETCTHLLCDTSTSKKYEFAMRWKISCVKSTWLYDSIKRGVCLDVKDYEHLPTTANPSHPDASYLSRPMLEETRDGEDNPTLRQISNLDLDVTLNKDKGYLEGCRIFLCGFTTTEQEQLKKLINNGRGMRCDKLSNRVTHIISKDDQTLKKLEDVSTLYPEAVALTVQWLVDSMEAGVMQPVQSYDMMPAIFPSLSGPATTNRPTPAKDNAESILEHYQLKTSGESKKVDTTTANDVTMSKSDVTMSKSDVTMSTNDVTMSTNDVTVTPNDATITKGDVTRNISTRDRTGSALERTHSLCAAELNKSELFKGYKFYIPTNVTSKIARNVQQQIIAHGGCCREHDVDFCVVDPFQEQPSCCPDKTHVTYMWLQRCIQAGEILSITDCILYTPRPVPVPCHVLKGAVICYTQFSGFELAHLCKVVEVLGGTPQGTFTHNNIKNSKRMPDCLACTHLICKFQNKDNRGISNSSKIKAAYKWRIPCITIDWLYDCLRNVKKVDTSQFEEFKLREEQRRHDNIHQAASDIAEQLPERVEAVTITERGSVLQHDTEGFVTPLKTTLKPKHLLKVEGVMAALESPAAGDHPGNTTTPNLNSLYKRNITTAVKKTTPPSKILSGVTLVVKQHKQLETPVSELKKMAKRNGAVVKTSLDRTCTHIVCSIKEVRDPNIEQALKQGVKAVSCHWVLASDEQKQRALESDYPPGYDPKRSLNISASENISVSAVEIDNTQPQPHPAGEEPALSLDANLVKEINMMENLAMKEVGGFVAPIDPGTPRSRSKSKNKRSTFNRKRSSNDVPEDDFMSQAPPTVMYEDGQAAREALIVAHKDDQKIEMMSAARDPLARDTESRDQDTESRDPTPDDTFNNSRLPNISLAPTSSSTPHKTSDEAVPKLSESEVKELAKEIDDDDFDMSDTSTNIDKTLDNKKIPPKQPHFLMTGLNENQKDQFGNIIQKLNGVLLNSGGFDSRCTHLVAGKPNRNEKFISSIGAGTWVLHPSYMTSSLENGSWLDEDSYTWDKFTSDLTGINKELGRCCSKWVHKKAFASWCVMMCISQSKVKSFKSIIESGGGKVLQFQPPYSVHRSITHSFIDPTLYNKISNDIPLAALIEAGVHCLRLEYIPEYLIHGDSAGKLDEFTLEPARQIMTSRGIVTSSKLVTSSHKRSIDTSLTGTPSKRSKT